MREKFIWDLTDAAATLNEILKQSGAGLGEVVVAHVDMASQRVTGTRIVTSRRPAADTDGHPAPEGETHRADLSRILRDVAIELAGEREWVGDRPAPITGVLITVVCRTGYVVDTAADWRWLMGWRYANHNSSAFDGDVYIVTPHGWTGILDNRCGLSPVLDRRRPSAVPAN